MHVQANASYTLLKILFLNSVDSVESGTPPAGFTRRPADYLLSNEWLIVSFKDVNATEYLLLQCFFRRQSTLIHADLTPASSRRFRSSLKNPADLPIASDSAKSSDLQP